MRHLVAHMMSHQSRRVRNPDEPSEEVPTYANGPGTTRAHLKPVIPGKKGRASQNPLIVLQMSPNKRTDQLQSESARSAVNQGCAIKV